MTRETQRIREEQETQRIRDWLAEPVVRGRLSVRLGDLPDELEALALLVGGTVENGSRIIIGSNTDKTLLDLLLNRVRVDTHVKIDDGLVTVTIDLASDEPLQVRASDLDRPVHFKEVGS
jgi:hypothetical protein